MAICSSTITIIGPAKVFILILGGTNIGPQFKLPTASATLGAFFVYSVIYCVEISKAKCLCKIQLRCLRKS